MSPLLSIKPPVELLKLSCPGATLNAASAAAQLMPVPDQAETQDVGWDSPYPLCALGGSADSVNEEILTQDVQRTRRSTSHKLSEEADHTGLGAHFL